ACGTGEHDLTTPQGERFARAQAGLELAALFRSQRSNEDRWFHITIFSSKTALHNVSSGNALVREEDHQARPKESDKADILPRLGIYCGCVLRKRRASLLRR